MSQKIKKGDTVQVIAGKDKGKRGDVNLVLPKKHKLRIQGLNLVKRHRKPNQNQSGGIETKEALLDISNVALIDPKDNKPTRVGFMFKNNQKVRISKRSREILKG